MKSLRTIPALAAVGTLMLLGACTPTDTTATSVVEQLTESLNSRELEPDLLYEGTGGRSFASLISPLAQYPLTVTPGEVTYEMNDAALPLAWEWLVEGETWAYETEVSLIYEDSRWWVMWQPESLHPEVHAGNLIGVDRRTPERAEVVDLDGTPIVTSRPIRKYGFDKPQVAPDDWEDAARAVADALDVDPDRFAARVLGTGPQAFVEARVVGSEHSPAGVTDDFLELPGAYVVSDTALMPPTEGFAREVLGTAGEPTAEIIENSGGTIDVGDIVGLSGLQRQYEEQLRGVGELEIFTVDASTCADPLECAPEDRTVIATFDAGAPQDLVLTLDIDLQIAAEEALGSVTEVDDGSLPGASLVAIRPSTGDVLAIANGRGNNGINHAALGQYTPGSTFKVVTALALLRSGLSPDDTVSCPETTTVGGWQFENNEAYPRESTGEVPFLEAFAHSCNTALIESGADLSAQDLHEAAQALGLGSATSPEDLGYPAFLGSVDPGDDPTQFAAALIGQGSTLASPLAMAAVAASVQAGAVVTPVLVNGHRPEVEVATPLTETEAEALRILMRAVTTDGTAQALGDVPGEAVLAKTGTAEHGSDWEAPHAWMIAAQGDLAVAVIVEAGISGSLTAGPIVKEFLTAAHSLRGRE